MTVSLLHVSVLIIFYCNDFQQFHPPVKRVLVGLVNTMFLVEGNQYHNASNQVFRGGGKEQDGNSSVRKHVCLLEGSGGMPPPRNLDPLRLPDKIAV